MTHDDNYNEFAKIKFPTKIYLVIHIKPEVIIH